MQQWELYLRVDVLQTPGSSDFRLLLHNFGLNDKDSLQSSLVSASHVTHHLPHCTIQRGFAVLPVHIVSPGARVVAHENAVGLDVVSVFLEYLADADDFAVGPLEVVHTLCEVPKAGLRVDFVLGKDAHAVDDGVGLALRGQRPARHDELPDVHLKRGVALHHGLLNGSRRSGLGRRGASRNQLFQFESQQIDGKRVIFSFVPTLAETNSLISVLTLSLPFTG